MDDPPLTLLKIPAEDYPDYRRDVIFRAYKWDPQVGDTNTISRYVVLLSRKAAQELCALAESLSDELCEMERALLARPDLLRTLGFSGNMKRLLGAIGSNNSYSCEDHVRLKRFDFHPTDRGWKISEVNSDVPGGLAEASVLPEIACEFFTGCRPDGNVASHVLGSFQSKLRAGSRIAFVHATSYADDRQVMQFLGDYFLQNGYRTLFAAPDHLRWKDKKAYSVLSGEEGAVDGIVRFFPLEWLETLPRESGWRGYFNCETACCNHPAAMLTQSKRLPLVWDSLGIGIPKWKALLPETKEPGAQARDADGWIYKPAFGRVGSGISIKGSVSEKELKSIKKAAVRSKRAWITQRMFNSTPIISPDGDSYHICLGLFTVDGKAAGFYARLGSYARIDEYAQDVPVLIECGV